MAQPKWAKQYQNGKSENADTPDQLTIISFGKNGHPGGSGRPPVPDETISGGGMGGRRIQYTGTGEDGKLQPQKPTEIVNTAKGAAMIHEGEIKVQMPDGTVRVIPANQVPQELLQKLEYTPPAVGVQPSIGGASSPQPFPPSAQGADVGGETIASPTRGFMRGGSYRMPGYAYGTGADGMGMQDDMTTLGAPSGAEQVNTQGSKDHLMGAGGSGGGTHYSDVSINRGSYSNPQLQEPEEESVGAGFASDNNWTPTLQGPPEGFYMPGAATQQSEEEANIPEGPPEGFYMPGAGTQQSEEEANIPEGPPEGFYMPGAGTLQQPEEGANTTPEWQIKGYPSAEHYRVAYNEAGGDPNKVPQWAGSTPGEDGDTTIADGSADQSVQESLDLIRNIANGMSDVDRTIANRYLQNYDASSAASATRMGQMIAGDPNMTQGAKNAMIAGLQRNISIGRAGIAGELATEAQQRAAGAALTLFNAEQQVQAFDENKRRWDKQFGITEANQMVNDAASMTEESWLKLHPGMTSEDYKMATLKADKDFDENKRRWDKQFGITQANQAAIDANVMSKKSWLVKYPDMTPEDFDAANRSFNENKDRWEKNYGITESNQMIVDAPMMSKASWLIKYKHAGVTGDDYDMATRMSDVNYDKSIFTIANMRTDDAGDDLFAYYMANPNLKWDDDPTAEKLLKTYWEALDKPGDFDDFADKQQDALQDPRITTVLGALRFELEQSLSIEVENGNMEQGEADDKIDAAIEFQIGLLTGELTQKTVDEWTVYDKDGEFVQGFLSEEDANAFATQNGHEVSDIKKGDRLVAYDSDGNLIDGYGYNYGDGSSYSVPMPRSKLETALGKEGRLLDGTKFNLMKKLLGRTPSYDEYILLESDDAKRFLEEGVGALGQYSGGKLIYDTLGEDFQEAHPWAEIIRDTSADLGDALDSLQNQTYFESGLNKKDFEGFGDEYLTGAGNGGHRWVMSEDFEDRLSRLGVGSWIKIDGHLYRLDGWVNNRTGAKERNTAPSVTLFDPAQGSSITIVDGGDNYPAEWINSSSRLLSGNDKKWGENWTVGELPTRKNDDLIEKILSGSPIDFVDSEKSFPISTLIDDVKNGKGSTYLEGNKKTFFSAAVKDYGFDSNQHMIDVVEQYLKMKDGTWEW